MAQTMERYKGLIGKLASASSILQYLVGGFVCYEIIKRKQTEDVPSMCFIGSLVIGCLGLKNSTILNDATTYNVYLICIVLHVLYLLVYIYYSQDRWNEVFQPLITGLTLVALLYSYAEFEDKTKIEFRYGLILTALLLIVLGFPLLNIGRIIREKDASSITFPIVLMSMVASTLWFLYSYAISNTYMMIQNGAAMFLCGTQILLKITYPNPPDEDLYVRRNL